MRVVSGQCLHSWWLHHPEIVWRVNILSRLWMSALLRQKQFCIEGSCDQIFLQWCSWLKHYNWVIQACRDMFYFTQQMKARWHCDSNIRRGPKTWDQMVGVQKSSSSVTSSKRMKNESLFVLCFSPNFTYCDSENWLNEQNFSHMFVLGLKLNIRKKLMISLNPMNFLL